MEKLANEIGRWRAEPVQRSVTKHGGHCTYAFTQCAPPVSTFIAQDSSTSGGVCESMSAHWIYYHAIGDSLWNWLIVDGQVSLPKLQYHIMVLQSQGILGDQDAATERWLRTKGMHRRQSSFTVMQSRQMGGTFVGFTGGQAPKLQSGTTRTLNCAELARAILHDDTGGAGCYKKLWLAGKAGEHVMAIWVAQDVMFFDANFGEFYFESRAGFYNWFTKSFWKTSLYNVGLSGRFELRPYAKAVN
jgi:YopT peptidase